MSEVKKVGRPKNKPIPSKFQFEPVAALYAIKHVPTQSLYIGCTTNLQKRMRVHISKLRKGVHPTLPLQTLWNQCPNEDEWEAICLLTTTTHTKTELHDLESSLITRATRELPEYIMLNTYKNEEDNLATLQKLEKALRVLGETFSYKYKR